MLERIGDQRDQKAILARIRKLQDEPEKQGKALLRELAGHRSVRAAGQRYRIVYRVKHDRVEVLVVSVGLRQQGGKRDVYRQLAKALRKRRS
jgi:mRNA interferase RelE/StbE